MKNGVTGVLVRERDDKALAQALLDAAQDCSFLSRIARAGGEAVRRNFDLSSQAERLEEIYLGAIVRGD